MNLFQSGRTSIVVRIHFQNEKHDEDTDGQQITFHAGGNETEIIEPGDTGGQKIHVSDDRDAACHAQTKSNQKPENIPHPPHPHRDNRNSPCLSHFKWDKTGLSHLSQFVQLMLVPKVL